MKRTWMITMLVAGALALSSRGSAAEQIKADLIGQCMGGREKCWKFQSVDQIKELVIKNKTEDAQNRLVTIALQLQATNASAKYAAEARGEYTNTASGWKIEHVGLLSLRKME